MDIEGEKDAIQRRDEALDLALSHARSNDGHSASWVVDQMCRVLLGREYEAWVAEAKAGVDGPNTYEWDEGV